MKQLVKLAASNKIHSYIFFDGQRAIATDFEMWIQHDCPQAIEKPVSIPVEKVKAALALSNAITIEGETINGLPFTPGAVEDFPQLPGGEEKEIVPDFALDLVKLKNIFKVMPKSDSRYYLNGALFDFNNRTLVATDGHRLHSYNNETLPLPAEPLKEHAIMPYNAVAYALALKSSIAAYFIRDSRYWFRISYPCGTITTRTIDGKFPDYQRVTPTESAHKFSIAAKPLAESLKKLLAVSKAENRTYHSVLLSFEHGKISIPGKDELHLIAQNITGVGNFDIGFNAEYLRDAVECLSENAVWGFRGGKKYPISEFSAHVVDGDFQAVIMPVRL